MKVIASRHVPTWSKLTWWQQLKQRLGFKVKVGRCAYTMEDTLFVSFDTYAVMVKAGMQDGGEL